MIKHVQRWVLLYWRVGLGAIGALLFALLALDTLKSWKIYLVVFGFLITLASVVFQASFANTNRELTTELKKLNSENDEFRSRRVFVLLAAFREHFQIELNYHLLRIGRESGLFLQVFCPSFDFSDDDFRNGLSNVLENASQYSGGLLVASKFGDDRVDELERFAKDVHIPVVFIDHIPPKAENGPESASALRNVSWVTVQDCVGGEKAAQAVADLGEDPSRVLVIAGPAKADRHSSFKKAVLARWPKCSITITTDGNFSRQQSQAVALKLLRRSLEIKQPYDTIFCTTDSMTLGCLDAIEHINWGATKVPTVIGYDGIEATRTLIDLDKTALKRVVVQDPVKLAGTAIYVLRKLTAGDSGSRIVWIEPTLYPNEVTGS